MKRFRKTKSDMIPREQVEALIGTFQLMLEDANWKKATDSILGSDVDKFFRDSMVNESRTAFKNYPAYSHIVDLNKAFILGREGITRPVSKNPLIQWVIDYIVDNKENKRSLTGYRAQEKIIEQRDITGEIFFKIYVNKKTGEAIVRLEKDTSKIKEIITEPGDVDMIQFYKYETARKEYDFATGETTEKRTSILIPDIRFDDAEAISRYAAKSKDGNVLVYGYLSTFGNAATNDGRGYPIYYNILKYLRAHKGVAEDAATMLKALSRYAWKKKFNKVMSKPQLDGLKNLAKTFNDDLSVNNVPDATAATLLEGSNVENQQVEIKHNGAAFWDTSRILIQQIASGSNKMEHYFGNPANANLATATSMELPMLKDFQRQQAEIAEVYETLITFLIMQTVKYKGVAYIVAKAKEDGYDLPKDAEALAVMRKELEMISWSACDAAVYMPEILDKENAQLILAAINAFNSGLLSDIDASFLIYSMLGFRNVDDKLSDIYGDEYQGNMGAGDDLVAKDERIKQLTDMLSAVQKKQTQPPQNDNGGTE